MSAKFKYVEIQCSNCGIVFVEPEKESEIYFCPECDTPCSPEEKSDSSYLNWWKE